MKFSIICACYFYTIGSSAGIPHCVKDPTGQELVQRILSNRHIDLSDFSYAALSSIAVATATPHSFALHMRKSSGVDIAET